MTIDTYSIYILCPRRDADYVKQMLDAFLRKPEPASDEYAYPQFVDSHVIFRDPYELMRVLERESNQPYSLYWNEAGNDDSMGHAGVTPVMAFFTEDAQLIVGCATLTDRPDEVLDKACRIVEAKFGFVTGEEVPPSTADEFKAVCEEATLPRVVRGVMYGMKGNGGRIL